MSRQGAYRKLLIPPICLAGLITVAGSNHNPPERPDDTGAGPSEVRVVALDFQPVGTADFDPVCTNDHMDYSNARLYRPTIRLAQPAPTGIDYHYWIQEDGVLSDPTIGYFRVRFETGDLEPSSILTDNVESVVESFMGVEINRMPVGSPAQTVGLFWMGCTRACVLRGNGPRGDGGAQNVFLASSSVVQYDDPSRVSRFTGLLKSPSHLVSCQ